MEPSSIPDSQQTQQHLLQQQQSQPPTSQQSQSQPQQLQPQSQQIQSQPQQLQSQSQQLSQPQQQQLVQQPAQPMQSQAIQQQLQPSQPLQQNQPQPQQQQQQQQQQQAQILTNNLQSQQPAQQNLSQVQTVPQQPPQSLAQTPTSVQPACSVATTPTVVSQLSQAPRGVPSTQIRPHAEYLVLIPNSRQPGIQGIRYLGRPIGDSIQAMNIANQPNILQSPLIRSINASQLIRTSSSGVMQTQTSQAQTTTMANIQGRHVQIPFGPTGPRGQITLPNGQTIMSSMPIQRHQMMTPRATILQQPTLIRGATQPGMGVHSVIPTSQPLGIGMQTSIGSPQMIHQTNIISTTPTATATPPSQMTPEDALAKGTSFFHSLLTKMAPTPQRLRILQTLIQNIIDGKITSEEFAVSLQKEMNSASQPQLVPFLDLMVPLLRQSLNTGTISLPGIRGPAQQDSMHSMDDSNASTSSPNKSQAMVASQKKKKIPLPPGQKSKYAIRKEQQEARRKEREILAAQAGIKIDPNDDKKLSDKGDKPLKPKSDKPRPKQKKQEKQLESLSSALRDDDDVNDVAAMGGVNLAEENQRIMASGAELVGTQIRSCKDEPFLDVEILTSRIAKITKEYNLPEPSKEVVTLISHATQERLKNMVERLGILAEHRSENLKLNPKYEVSTDIKGQMKFLAELDRIEKRRYEEQERELLLKVAKSRSKVEDPEQQKLRQKAKDMQRAEQEEVRQREANETALLAIGPRKKLKASITSSTSSFSQSNNLKDTKTDVDMRGDTIRRIKRVNMRDLQVLLELDRTHLNRLIKITSQ